MAEDQALLKAAAHMEYLYNVRKQGLPRDQLSQADHTVLEHWTDDMLRVYASSGGKRVYIDQQSTLRVPDSYEPRAQVAAPYRLTQDDMREFYQRGFIGPLTAFSVEQMAEFKAELADELSRPSKSLGMQTDRDRHLDSPLLRNLFRNPMITETLAQLLGPDLQIWRSQYFNKRPGDPAVTWHQATTYMLENHRCPLLEPIDRDELFQLTIWIAVDEATIDNGCLQFVSGTHCNTYTVTLGGESSFYAARFVFDLEIDPAKVVSMELKPGQFTIFSERVVHGSPANNSDKRRMGINFRVVQPSTRVYRDMTTHNAFHMQQSYDLSNWGVLQLRGEDKFGYNRHMKLPEDGI